MGLNSIEISMEETKLREFKSQLTCTQIRAEYSLQMEGVVGAKFVASQKEMTNRWFDRVATIRKRIEEIERNITLLKTNK